MTPIKLTIFTPTYNRINTLRRTYASLREQTVKDFIWLIIDDGSTDDTAAEVKNWQTRENGFEIRYIYKENGGMHTAHNAAYENIDTELNTCIDSDDAMPKDAVEKILKKWEQVSAKGYAGIIGLDTDFEGRIIGSGFPTGLKETTLTEYYENGGKGDKKLVYRTAVINRYPPYPVFPGEKYVALAYKYRLIDQAYQLAVLNEPLCLVEYRQDGSTMNMLRQYKRNPKGFAFWRKVCMQHPTTKRRMYIDCVHYVSSSILAGNKGFLRESPKKVMTLLAAPFGGMLAAYVMVKVR